MEKGVVICLVVLALSSPIHGFLGVMNWGGMGGMGGMGGAGGSPLSAYMGIQMCNPGFGRRGGAGQAGGGMPGMGGRQGRGGMPGQPGGQAVSQRPSASQFFMGMAVDVADAPDFGCFCQNFGSECLFGLGFGVTDPTCSRWGLCCSCDGWI